jgi:hypothetical protein
MKDSQEYTTVSLSDKEDEIAVELTEAVAVNLSHLYVDQPIKTVNPEYANLPELKGLTWTDSFFDEDDDIIAVFDFDYDAMESFYTNMGWAAIASTLLYSPLFIAQLVALVPCYLRKNVRWSSRSQHVAITRDGIRFVHDRRPSCWGLSCTDQGKTSKTGRFHPLVSPWLDIRHTHTLYYEPLFLPQSHLTRLPTVT